MIVYPIPQVARTPTSAFPYHGQVFRLAQLRDVVTMYGLPTDKPEALYDGYAYRRFEKCIEVQVWSDEPIGSVHDHVH
jgi:hypothetical protein